MPSGGLATDPSPASEEESEKLATSDSGPDIAGENDPEPTSASPPVALVPAITVPVKPKRSQGTAPCRPATPPRPSEGLQSLHLLTGADFSPRTPTRARPRWVSCPGIPQVGLRNSGESPTDPPPVAVLKPASLSAVADFNRLSGAPPPTPHLQEACHSHATDVPPCSI